MELHELAEDLWERFCRMDDHMQAIWLEEYNERPVRFVLMKDINTYLDEKYHRDYVAFYKRLTDCRAWEDSAFDVNKKWFIDYQDCNAMSSDDTLTVEAYVNANLLSELKETSFCKVLGYTEKEITDIQTFLSSCTEDEIEFIWKKAMRKKMWEEVNGGVSDGR